MQKSKKAAGRTRDRAAEVANVFEWLITAFVLALVFRAFVMEAFRIPTGSMADTLMGAHYRLRCTQCGYKYRYGQTNAGPRGRPIPRRYVGRDYSRCPSCGYSQSARDTASVSNGDRILVLKCIYQFFEPRQWDVIVFKNPLNPSENYIKRLVGRPEEHVEIIDGDVYIDGQISRKPAKVQEELWMPVYDNDYQPARPEEPSFNGHTWEEPFKNEGDSKWMNDEENPVVFKLASSPNEVQTLVYDTSLGNDFRSTYAYDETTDYRYMPFCSDLMVQFWANSSIQTGLAGVSLSKYGIQYTGRVDFNGEMSIAQVADGNEEVLATRTIAPAAIGKPAILRFANVDHKLVLEFADEKLSCDMGREPNDMGPRRTEVEPKARIIGAGRIEVSHIALFRDIHYTARNPNTSEAGRATEGHSLLLEQDQFFVLGDNSPRSEDGRWWSRPGRGNNGKSYPEGIVPREYLVGKALFVYWPAGFRPYAGFPLAVIPNVGELRFIYGGSDKVK